jgi:hypothetical protein
MTPLLTPPFHGESAAFAFANVSQNRVSDDWKDEDQARRVTVLLLDEGMAVR